MEPLRINLEVMMDPATGLQIQIGYTNNPGGWLACAHILVKAADLALVELVKEKTAGQEAPRILLATPGIH